MDKALFISIALFLYLKYRAKEQISSEEEIPYEWLDASEPLDYWYVAVGTLPFENSVMQYKVPIMKYGQDNGIEAAVIAGIIGLESKGVANAVGYGKYFGLMQFGIYEARAMGYTGTTQGLLNPDTNIKYGSKYLKYCISQRGDLAKGISGYNRGNVENPKTPYNADYVDAVSSYVPRFRDLLSQSFPGYAKVFPKETWLKTGVVYV